MFGGIGYEQAVYGSFPFWSRGYALLAASEGCRPEWREAMKRACARFGERPAGVGGFRSVFALPADRSAWMVVRVDSLGLDDRGRPGALAFHAVFVSNWSYRRAGGSPLAFRPAFRDDWSAADQDATLPPGRFRPERSRGREATAPDPRADSIAAALSRKRRVVVQSEGPADELLRATWRRLPGRARRATKAATWAFGNANGFDFVALPRLGGLKLDGTELVLTGGGATAAP